MKCPICGQELRPGKKDPNYLLCYNCKKKFKAPASKARQEIREPREAKEQKYANIPPKHVREKREDEMRKAYDELLSIEDDKKKKKKSKAQPKPRRREELDDYYDEYEDDKVSKAPVIILGIAILVVAAMIVYMLLK